MNDKELELACEELVKILSTDDYSIDEVLKETNYSAVAPSVGGETNYQEALLSSSPLFSDPNLMIPHPIPQRLQYILLKIEQCQDVLVFREDESRKDHFLSLVPKLLRVCQPLLSFFESNARNTSSGQSLHPKDTCNLLLQFSQQLSSHLEQLVVSYASNGFISLSETDPAGFPYFSIGHCQVDNIKLSTFRYFQPTPHLAITGNKLFKRMRWNVKRLKGTEAGVEEEKKDTRTEVTQKTEAGHEAEKEKDLEGRDAEYYLLCFEVSREVEEERLREQTDRKPDEEVLRMWSIGKWVQAYPDPRSEDITDWVLCPIPEGDYRPLLYLGLEEPSSCTATDRLLEMLLSRPN